MKGQKTESSSRAVEPRLVPSVALVEAARGLAISRLEAADAPGRQALEHARGTATILHEIGADPVAEAAAWLYAIADSTPGSHAGEASTGRNGNDIGQIAKTFGAQVATVCESMRKLRALRELHRHQGDGRDREAGARLETLRRMLLAMSVDVRVVLLRLASRLQTLRRHRRQRTVADAALCRETLEVLAPLANRLGLWQLKWEMEDLAFRFLMPDQYHELAGRLRRTRVERELMVTEWAAELERALLGSGLQAKVHGRPKHLYSIYRKMQSKALVFSQIHDLLALRVIMNSLPDCYAALDVIHGLWEPVAGEYDDYISRPKPNGYQSLHSVVHASAAVTLEVQVRTRDMHEAAEYGGASHWRYKEGLGDSGEAAGAGTGKSIDASITWLRQLLAWQSEVGRSLGGANDEGRLLDDHIYVLTPQGRIVALRQGATPVDFAYHLHTELGHQCRGARVDGRMVPLSSTLATGQTVEIVTASARAQLDPLLGPSRDWLNPELGFLATSRARSKVRQWFAARESERARSEGRATVERILQREGRTALSLEKLARRLGFADPGALFAAVAHSDLGPRAIEQAARGDDVLAAPVRVEPPVQKRARADAVKEPTVIVAGVGSLMTHLARCCNPQPVDQVAAFVTRSNGISIHRRDCTLLASLRERAPERVLSANWANAKRANTLAPEASDED